MKKCVGIFLIVMFFVLPASVFAQSDKPVKNIVSLAKDEVVDQDYFAGGEIVEIAGTVNGDLYVAGGQVSIDGVINGDVLAAGGMVTISGEVTQDVRVAGGQVLITGKVGRNLTTVGGNVEIGNSAELGGNLVAGVGNLSLRAPVPGDVTAGVGFLRISDNTKIGGDLNYWSDEDISIAAGATVSGEITKNKAPSVTTPSEADISKGVQGFNIFAKLVSIFSSFILGLLLIKLFPGFSTKVVKTISSRPWASLGAGFAGLILIPILVLFLFISIFALPLGLMLMLSYIIYVYISRVFFMAWIGDRILRSKERPINLKVFLPGLGVYYLLTFVGIVAPFVIFMAVVVGIGASLISLKRVLQ